MHIDIWARGQGNSIGRAWHGGHREHDRDSAKALQNQATQDVVAALRKRFVADSSAAQADGSATGSPMQTLVATVQSAISLRASSGADPVPDVLNAVRGALSDARAALTKAGASDDEAEKAVSSVSQQLSAALSAAPPANAPAAQAAATQAATAPTATAPASSSESTLSVTAAASNFVLTYVRKQKASLDILTQEGDRVQIQFRSKEAITASGSTTSNSTTATSSAAGNATLANAAGATQGAAQAGSLAAAATGTAGAAAGNAANTATASTANSSTTVSAAPGTSIHAFASGRVEVSVQGQLSADELKAIGELATKVDALANEFFQGDLQQAFNSAAALGFDSSQIAGFALKLSQQESVSQSGALPAPKPATATAPAAAPAAPAPAAATPVVTPVAAAAEPAPISFPASPLALDSISTTPAATTDASNSTDAATAAAPATADDQAATLQDTLGSFLRKVLDTLATPNSGGRLQFSMRWKLSLVVAAVEAGAPKAAQSVDSGTSLLTRSLKDVAAQAPVDATPAATASSQA